MQQTAPKKDLKVASKTEPWEKKKSRRHKPQLVVHKRRTLFRAFRVEVGGKSLVFINLNPVDDIRALMVRKFGADRVGAITAIGTPGSSGEAS